VYCRFFARKIVISALICLKHTLFLFDWLPLISSRIINFGGAASFRSARCTPQHQDAERTAAGDADVHPPYPPDPEPRLLLSGLSSLPLSMELSRSALMKSSSMSSSVRFVL
jgi:hypothetical protein